MPLRGENVVVAQVEEPTIYGVSRRKFLIGASAVAATPFLARLAVALLDGGDRIDFDALGLRPVSIGYIEGSGTRAKDGSGGYIGPESFTGARIVPAAAARTGDGSLTGRLVRARIHGLYPSRSALAPDAQIVAVNGLFASRQPDAPYPFFAWTLQAHDVETMSHRSNFWVGLDRNPRFGIAVEVVTTTGLAIAATVFGTGSGINMAKLRAGTYLLGVGHDSWDRPRTLPAAGAKAWERLASIVLTVDPADD
jgi:hypothetical protein